SFRPLDAVAAAAPVFVIFAFWSKDRARLLAATAAAGVIGSLPTLWYNAATTGSWHTFGYTVLWGPGHSLGFHPAPFGLPLSLAPWPGRGSISTSSTCTCSTARCRSCSSSPLGSSLAGAS